MTKYIAREEVKRIICEICGECDGNVDVCEFRDIKVDTITAVDAIELLQQMQQPKTNADRIRGMSDEELAELWWERVDCGECPVHRDCRMTGQDCKKLALGWLKEEV